jgi:hypothetical protein
MCTCQQCSKKYKVDLLLPNEIWKKINKKSVNLLCGNCIVKGLEKIGYSAFKITPLG